MKNNTCLFDIMVYYQNVLFLYLPLSTDDNVADGNSDSNLYGYFTVAVLVRWRS